MDKYKLFLHLIVITLVFHTSDLAAQKPQKLYEESVDLLQKRDYENALIKVNLALNKDPKQERFYLQKAQVYANMNNIKAVLQTFEDAIIQIPDSMWVYYNLAMIHEQLKDFRNEIDVYSRALRICKDDSMRYTFYFNRGVCYSKIRQSVSAKNDYESAMKIDSSNINLLVNYASVMDDLGDTIRGIEILEDILKIEPTNQYALINLGYKNNTVRNYQMALVYLNLAVLNYPTASYAYSNRAFSKLHLNDIEGAMKDINMAISLEPTFEYAYRTRALIEIEAGKINEACADLDMAIKLGFTDRYGGEVLNLKDKNCPKEGNKPNNKN